MSARHLTGAGPISVSVSLDRFAAGVADLGQLGRGVGDLARLG